MRANNKGFLGPYERKLKKYLHQTLINFITNFIYQIYFLLF